MSKRFCSRSNEASFLGLNVARHHYAPYGLAPNALEPTSIRVDASFKHLRLLVPYSFLDNQTRYVYS
jgi:hypothetical protein